MSIFHKRLTILIFVAILIVVAVVMSLLVFGNRGEIAQDIPEEKIVTITYTGKGFEPQHVRVSPGTKVVWVNNNPAHNLRLAATNITQADSFPDFGSSTGVGQGDSYSYTFNEPGTLQYHNTANPMAGGAVDVVDE